MSRHDEYMKQIDALIKEHGWALQGVFPRTAADGPQFTYTVGLTEFNHPELIIMSLPYEVAGVMLNAMGRRVRAGERFTAGQTLLEVGNLAMKTVDVVDTRPYFGVARRKYHRVRAVQVVWPDKNSRFPWEPGYEFDPSVQPLLGVWHDPDSD